MGTVAAHAFRGGSWYTSPFSLGKQHYIVFIQKSSHPTEGDSKALGNQKVPTLTFALSLKGEGVSEWTPAIPLRPLGPCAWYVGMGAR